MNVIFGVHLPHTLRAGGTHRNRLVQFIRGKLKEDPNTLVFIFEWPVFGKKAVGNLKKEFPGHENNFRILMSERAFGYGIASFQGNYGTYKRDLKTAIKTIEEHLKPAEKINFSYFGGGAHKKECFPEITRPLVKRLDKKFEDSKPSHATFLPLMYEAKWRGKQLQRVFPYHTAQKRK